MFYLRELFFRFKYSLNSLVFVFLICFKYKTILFILFTYPVLFDKTQLQSNITHFIYTHPVELFNIYLLLITLYACLLFLPYICWQGIDFLKSSLHVNEYKRLKRVITYTFGTFLIINIFSFLIVLPKVWILVNKFNYYAGLNQEINFFFELKVSDYFSFFVSYLYYINIFILILFFTYAFINYLGLKELIRRKKLFIFLNIVFATLLSPPDVSSQLIILFFLTLMFEYTIYFYIFLFKFKKYSII